MEIKMEMQRYVKFKSLSEVPMEAKLCYVISIVPEKSRFIALSQK